jgi:hypothetical protein
MWEEFVLNRRRREEINIGSICNVSFPQVLKVLEINTQRNVTCTFMKLKTELFNNGSKHTKTPT